MAISRPYLRAVILNLVLLLAFIAWAFYMDGGLHSKYHAGTIGALEVGSIVGTIVMLLVGTVLWIGKKSWPLWFVGFVSASGWLALLLLGMWLSPHAGDLMQVQP